MRTVRPLFQLIRSYLQNTTRIPGPLEPHTSGKPERIRISLTEIPHQCPQRLALQRGPITRHHFQHASEERSPAEVAQDSLNCELAPNSLLADGSRHSPARKQPPERSTDMHPPAPRAITTPEQHQRPAPLPHKDPARSPYLGSKEPGRTRRSEISLPKKGHAMPNDGIAYLLKFAPKVAYIEDLLNGHLYMNAAGCYHGLPGEQGDPLEASMAPGACLYRYTSLPIYCMYTVRENDIVNNTVKIPKHMIQEFGCEDGWIGIVQYDSFVRLADRHTTGDGSIYAHGPISYGVPGPKLIREIFEGIPHNLVIKTPKYAYQKEYRIIGSRPVECRLLPDENHPGCKIEKYDHAELDLSSSLADFSWKVSVASLEEARDGLMLDLPH